MYDTIEFLARALAEREANRRAAAEPESAAVGPGDGPRHSAGSLPSAGPRHSSNAAIDARTRTQPLTAIPSPIPVVRHVSELSEPSWLPRR